MDALIPKINNIFTDFSSTSKRPHSARPKSARPNSARSSSSLSARAHQEKKEAVAGNSKKNDEKKNKEDKGENSNESESDDYEEECDWAIEIDKAHSVTDAMRRLWLADSELFYLKGDIIKNMVRYRIENGWSVASDSDEEDNMYST